MSAKLMGQVWDLDLPHNDQSVLLALADHADHFGNNVYPSNGLIGWKTGFSEDSVRRAKKRLVADGILIKVRERAGRTTVYRIDLSKGKLKAPFKAEEPPAECHPRQNATPRKKQAHPPQKAGAPPAQPCKANHSEPKEPSEATPTSGVEDLNPHQAFIDLWTEAYAARFGRAYFFQGAKDGNSVKLLLQGSKKTPKELIEVVKKAWERMHLFGCKRSNSISGFLSAYNDVLLEIETGQPTDKLPPMGYTRGQRPPSPPQSNGWNKESFDRRIGKAPPAASVAP